MIYYWNENNFKGMKRIGEHYSNIAGYEMFGEYCLLREQGLRKPALAKLNEFIEFIKSSSIDFQREVTCEIIQRQYEDMGRTHQMIVKPLSNYFETVLKAWADDEPQNVIPIRWLGANTSNIEYYEKAFEIDPADEISVFELCKSAIELMDFGTHHIHESTRLHSKLIYTLPDLKAALERAKAYCKILKTEKLMKYAQSYIAYFDKLLAAWEDYQVQNIDLSFEQWCNDKGHKFDFNATYYYDK